MNSSLQYDGNGASSYVRCNEDGMVGCICSHTSIVAEHEKSGRAIQIVRGQLHV